MSKYDENYKIDEVFKVDIGDLKPHLPNDDSPNKSLREIKEMYMYQDLENEYQCSGMCESGLFFFSRELHEGPPSKTCFGYFKKVLHESAEGIAINSVFCGVVALFIFFAHFSLYCRPVPDE